MRAILAFLAFGGLVKAQNCPEPYGVQVYPNEQYCDKFYKVCYTQCYFSTYFNYNFHFLKKKSVSMVPFMTKRAKMVWFSMVATELYTIFAIIIGPLIAENVYMTIPPFHPQDVFTNMASTPWESVVKQHFISVPQV